MYRLNAVRNGHMLTNLPATCARRFSIFVYKENREWWRSHGVLNIDISARAMLTTNVDVSDGLVNGARGEIFHVVTDTNDELSSVLIKFDNQQVGLKAMPLPISKVEVVFLALRSHAYNFHSHYTGLLLSTIVVDMQGNRFNAG